MPRLLSPWFAAVLVVWLGVRLVYFNGYYTEDAPGYVGDAITIARGEYQARHHVNGLNIGTYAPIALPLLVLGKTDAALSLWPLACSLLGVLSIGGLAGLLWGRGFGLLAGFLYATYPGDVFFSTVVMPDAIQSGWLSLSLFLVTLACTNPSPRTQHMLVAAGVAMGVCHLIRANGALLLPIGLVAVALFSSMTCPASRSTPAANSPWLALAHHGLAYMAGWLLVFVAEGLAYRLAVGDFLFRFHVVDRHYGTATSIAQWGLNTHPLTIPYSAFAPLTWHRFGGWGAFNPDQSYHGLLFTFALLAVLVGAVALVFVRRPARGRFVVVLVVAVFWFAWPLLYHQAGTQSLLQYIPIHRLSRHLVVYAPGAIVALVAGCAVTWQAVRSRGARTALSVVALGLLLLHLYFNVQAERLAYTAYHQIKDTYARIVDRLPSDTRLIIGDPGDLGFFDFWLNPLDDTRVQLHAFANYPTCESMREGVVLTYSNPGWERLSAPSIQATVARLPCVVAPPPAWRLLYDGFPEKVFVIRLQASGSRLQAPGSRLQAPGFRLQAPGSRLQASGEHTNPPPAHDRA
jgi:hypothetical protein